MTDLIQQARTWPIVDVHEHHLPELYLKRDVGLLDILQQSYAGWTQARPYCLPSEHRTEDPMLTGVAAPTWEMIQPFVEWSGSSSFVRNLIGGLAELYGLPEEAITEQNWQALDQAIRVKHRDVSWPSHVMHQAGIQTVITDAYTNPLLNPVLLGPNYYSVCRINCFAFAWNPQLTDHNGNRAASIAESLGLPCSTFSEFKEVMRTLVRTLPDRRQVALKNALAYDRDLHFDGADEKAAAAVWGNATATAVEQKRFGDWVVSHFCDLAAEFDVPVQMHLGTALIRGSHPLNVAPLIEAHPRTRFLLMHLAYPWSADLLAMAFVYRNIWIDLTWSFLLSPSHFKRALHEAIEILPDESRMMMGGDNWHVEETFASFRTARRLIGEVLQEKVEIGYFLEADAVRLGKKIFSDNARKFFKFV